MGFLDRVVVATDSDEVAEVCRRAGAGVVLTSGSHRSGTDRVSEAAARFNGDFEVVLNIQGDEPLVTGEALQAAISMVEQGFDIGTCATPIRSRRELADPAVVKVVRTAAGSALYFSRAPIPHRHRASAGDAVLRRGRPPQACGRVRLPAGRAVALGWVQPLPPRGAGGTGAVARSGERHANRSRRRGGGGPRGGYAGGPGSNGATVAGRERDLNDLNRTDGATAAE